MEFKETALAAFFIYAVFPFLLLLLLLASHQPWDTYIIPLLEVYYLLTLVGGFLLAFAWIAKLATNRL